ncbi:MAG: biotin-dependent carboxyltransferase family protein [Clostridiales bacterium]|nr:biotin-dependent carboxyltransferase family protein [Clostridiales bacterium]
MGIVITNVGPATTVQDAGRIGYMAFGFQASGAMDMTAFRTANILVGNDRDAAAIEMTLIGISGEFTSDAVIAVTGADVAPSVNGISIPLYQAIKVRKGDVISCSFARSGCRAYLAVQSGFYLKKVMGSYSTNTKCKIGGYLGRPLQKGDLLYFNTTEPCCDDGILYADRLLEASAGKAPIRKIAPPEALTSPSAIRAVLGPQDDYFTDKGIKTLFDGEYKLTNDSDRMGIKLDGEIIESKSGADIISDGIPLGAVQIPSSGKPIIMTADRQTVGGYAKIAVVISADIPVIAQMKPGDTLRFIRVSLEDAQRAYIDALKDVEKLEKRFAKLWNAAENGGLTGKIKSIFKR